MTEPGIIAPAVGSGPTLGADVLRGVRQIASFIGEEPRRTYYLLERGMIPAGKQGDQWIASRRTLRAHYAKLTGGEPK